MIEMTDACSLAGQFLIAMPTVQDPIFADSLILVCDHGKSGAIGLIVNHPSELNMSEVYDQMKLTYQPDIGKKSILLGGPVATDRGFVLHHDVNTKWDSSIRINQDLAVTTSLDIIESLAQGNLAGKSLFAVGYTGWDSGQLEQEIIDNHWLTLPYDADLLFETNYQERIELACAKVGVRRETLFTGIGHA